MPGSPDAPSWFPASSGLRCLIMSVVRDPRPGPRDVLVVTRQDYALPGKDLQRIATAIHEHLTVLVTRGILTHAAAHPRPPRERHRRTGFRGGTVLTVQVEVTARNTTIGLATALAAIRGGFDALAVTAPGQFTPAELAHLVTVTVGDDVDVTTHPRLPGRARR